MKEIIIENLLNIKGGYGMLIPKCCKGCSGRGSGVCNCTLPIYCQEYVEDEEVIKPITYTTTSDTFMKSLGNWAECLDCKEKDHRIALLEKALGKACEVIKEIIPNQLRYMCGEALAKRLGISMTSEIKDYDYFIHQAEKELEEKK